MGADISTFHCVQGEKTHLLASSFFIPRDYSLFGLMGMRGSKARLFEPRGLPDGLSDEDVLRLKSETGTENDFHPENFSWLTAAELREIADGYCRLPGKEPPCWTPIELDMTMAAMEAIDTRCKAMGLPARAILLYTFT